MENSEVMNAQPETLDITLDGAEKYLYEELWRLCAGPLVNLPEVGSKVYYFPQGNLEHIKASTKEELDMMKPFFDLPAKLQCNVANVKFKAEKNTDEVYAEISLIPNTIKINIHIPDDNQPMPIVHSFTKVLTVSDTRTHSGLSIPKKHAAKCLPPLDMTQPTPTQELLVKDLHGYEWRFKHIFRGAPERHLFTTGWNAFAMSKRLFEGDSFVFVRSENGELRVGIKRSIHRKCNIPSPVFSRECMPGGVNSSIIHAINNHCMFTVIYKPRLSQFVVSFDRYADAVKNKFNVGSRFKMRFENEDFTEIRYSGTVVGKKDLSHNWKDSEWRSLEVQWDDPASIPRPDKVSPWEIESLAYASNFLQSSLLKNKRPRQVDEFGSSSNPGIPTFNQGQEIGESSMRPQMSASKIPSSWLMSNHLVPTMPKLKNNDQVVLPLKKRINLNATTSCKVFGVDMATTSTEIKNITGPINPYQKFEICKLSKDNYFEHNKTLTLTQELQSKPANSTRNRTKVQMQGVAIGRAVDLTRFYGYTPLIEEIEKLFDIKGELQTRNQWEITFTDNEGDMMLVADYPWPEFYNMVKKIFIYSKEEVKKMKSGNKLSRGESKS